jgi:hypothetical protein
MADPLDYSAIQDVMFRTSKQVVPVVASQTSVRLLLSQFSSVAEEGQELYENLTGVVPLGEIVPAEDLEDVVDAAKLAKDTKLSPVIRLVNLMLSGAAKLNRNKKTYWFASAWTACFRMCSRFPNTFRMPPSPV